MLCPTCGKENPDGARFCRGCGAPLNAPQPETPPMQEQPAWQQPPVQEQPVWQQPPVQEQPVWQSSVQQTYNSFGYAPAPAPTLKQKTPITLWIARALALVAACSLFMPFLSGTGMGSSNSMSGLDVLKELFKAKGSTLNEDLSILFMASVFLPIVAFLVSWVPHKGGAVASIIGGGLSLAACGMMLIEMNKEFGFIGTKDMGYGFKYTVGTCTMVGAAASLAVVILAIVALAVRPKNQ